MLSFTWYISATQPFTYGSKNSMLYYILFSHTCKCTNSRILFYYYFNHVVLHLLLAISSFLTD